MTEQQILKLIRRAQRPLPGRGAARIELPPEPTEVEDEYFQDPLRPRLSPRAFVVWAYLLRRAEPESRIALVSYRDIRWSTGIHSSGGIRSAILELARYGYCIPGLEPTGPGLPRNYKIPLHIGSASTNTSQLEKLHRQAERPRRASGTALRKIRKALQEAQAGPARPQPDLAAKTPAIASETEPSPPPGAPSLKELPLVLIERREEPKEIPPGPLGHRPRPDDGPSRRSGPKVGGGAEAMVNVALQADQREAGRLNISVQAGGLADPANADMIQAIAKLDQEIEQAIKARGKAK